MRHALPDVAAIFRALRQGGAAVAAATRELAAWLEAAPALALVRLDQAVRERGPYVFPGPEVHDVARLARLPESWAALGLTSMVASGHVREAAVRALAAHAGHELPFLLLRANDWVAQVRLRALTALDDRLSPARGPAWVAALPLVLALREQTRHDHTRLLNQILALLGSPELDVALRGGFRSPDREVRRACYGLAWGRPGVLDAAFADPETAIRSRALRRAGDAAEPDQVRPFLRDRSGPLRARALAFLVAHGAATDDEVRHALLDRHDRSRALARGEAARRGVDVPAFYRGALDRSPAAVLGLCEAAPREVDRVLAVLSTSPTPVLRRAAVRGLGWVSGDWSEVLVASLLDESPAVVGEARRQLLAAAAPAASPHLRALVARTDAPVLARAAAVDVLAAGPKWTALVDLLRALRAGGPGLVAPVTLRLSAWLDSYNRRRAQPTREELATLRELVAHEGLRGRVAEELRLVVGTFLDAPDRGRS